MEKEQPILPQPFEAGERNQPLESIEKVKTRFASERAGNVETRELQAAPSAQPTIQPQILPATQGAAASSPTQTTQADPLLVAADKDRIEKVWVDKAKKIVQDTKEDPYRQEDQVSRLRADYIKKRYGKEVKLADIR